MDPYLALLLKATPIDSRLPSPGELLQNRQLKTTLPAIIRSPANNESIRASLQSRQGYINHDAHAKELPQVLSKQHVWAQNSLTKQLYKVAVQFKAETLRSYVVPIPDHDIRNRIYLKDADGPKFVPNAQPNPQRSVPRKPPSVLVALKQLGGNGLPKYVLRSIPNPGVNSAEGNSIPNTSVNNVVGIQIPYQSVNSGVQNSHIQNGVISAQDPK